MRTFALTLLLGCTGPSSGDKVSGGTPPADSGLPDVGDTDPDAPADTAETPEHQCNGHEALCDRPLTEVAFAGTHNSMSSEEAGWLAPNHRYGVPRQLADGVRALNFDLYEVDGVATLCHGYCELGSQPLVDALGELRDFLDQHPREVLLLTFENYASAALTVAAFEDSGLTDRVYAHTAGAPWPTLGTLIDQERRLVVFTSDGGGEPDWYHGLWDWWRDNPYYAEVVAEFSCAHYRGEEENDLYAINHFLTAPIALAELAEEANQAEVIRAHVDDCRTITGRFPNLILVDFYSIGGLFEVVDALNRSSEESR